ncbi:hypothetical protein EZS27_040713, partial [termite gut metagenome]
CANYGDITSSTIGAAGICYYQNNTTTIGACYNAGTIKAFNNGTGNYFTGGIVGRLSAGTITSCYNTGTIIKTGSSTSITIGTINGSYTAANIITIENCYYSENSYTSAGELNTTSKTFTEAWPTSDDSYWGVGTSGTEGAYWSSLGTPGSTTDYPKLYWE